MFPTAKLHRKHKALMIQDPCFLIENPWSSQASSSLNLSYQNQSNKSDKICSSSQ